jgi:hypothetical protein
VSEADSIYEITFPVERWWPAGWAAEHPEVTVASRTVDGLRDDVEEAWNDQGTEAAIRAGLRLLRAERALARVQAKYPNLQYVGPMPKYSTTRLTGAGALYTYWRKVQQQVVNAYYAAPAETP